MLTWVCDRTEFKFTKLLLLLLLLFGVTLLILVEVAMVSIKVSAVEAVVVEFLIRSQL